MKFQIVHQAGAPFEGQDWVTEGVPLFDSQEEATAYLASGVLSPDDPYDKTRHYTYYVREADQYPACHNDPPVGVHEKCDHEYCPRHTTVWLESEGLTHAAAIGITAVLDYLEREYVGIVADALGGFDSFDQVTDHQSVWDSGPLMEWYGSHLPLVVYCLEQSSWRGMDYWHQALDHNIRINE
jgi:hypothetical protein